MSAWDVVVVGGGPAGSAMAARLAGAGHRTLLIDRERFPRPKACGECLNPAAVAALDRLGALPLVRAAPHSAIPGWSIHSHPGGVFTGRFPAGQPGIAISRTTLDRILLANAAARGAEVRTGVRVTGLLEHRGTVVGVQAGRPGSSERISARLVVGADGLRSVVVRRLGMIRRYPRLRKLALTGHVYGLPSELLGQLHLLGWGCIGVAQVAPGIANVTVVLNPRAAGAITGSREEFFDGFLRRHPFLRGATRTGGVMATGPFDWPVRRAVANGALLVGDAAGYYDPFTGQGIYRALRGAELAAETADPALREGDVSIRALLPYERARKRAFDAKVRLQVAIEAFVARPLLMRSATRLLAWRPDFADALVRVTGDLQPVRSLVDPRLAVRSLVSG